MGKNIFNVKQYGASGNGINNDTNAINNAILSAHKYFKRLLRKFVNTKIFFPLIEKDNNFFLPFIIEKKSSLFYKILSENFDLFSSTYFLNYFANNNPYFLNFFINGIPYLVQASNESIILSELFPVVYFPEGCYRVTTIKIPYGVHLKGNHAILKRLGYDWVYCHKRELMLYENNNYILKNYNIIESDLDKSWWSVNKPPYLKIEGLTFDNNENELIGSSDYFKNKLPEDQRMIAKTCFSIKLYGKSGYYPVKYKINNCNMVKLYYDKNTIDVELKNTILYY